MSRKLELAGKRFGNLYVISLVPDKIPNRHKWLCKCDCGNTYLAKGYNLANGRVKSCGCNQRKGHKTHGMSHTSLHKRWRSIKDRCTNPRCERYADYGGRGITICDEWENDFVAFMEWALSHGYEESLTIDRIDVNGNYEPDNCRWITLKEQNMNKRNNHFLTFNGETHTLTEWSKIRNIPLSTIYCRIYANKTNEEILAKKEN